MFRRINLPRCWGLFIFILLPCLVYSQNHLIDFQCFGIEEGLPAKVMVNIGQDKNGFMWFSSPSGIHKYDGYQFYTWSNSELNLQDPMVAYFAIDSENRIWYSNRANTMANDSGGIIDLETGKVFSVKKVSEGRFGLKDIEFVANPNPGSDNREVIIATHDGTYYRYDGAFEKLITLEGRLWMGQVCREARGGGYWIVNDGKLIRIDDGVVQAEYAIPMEAKQRVSTLEVTNGIPRIEIGRKLNNRYFVLKEGEIVPFTAPPGTSSESLNGLFLDHSDFVVFATIDSVQIKDWSGNLLWGEHRDALWNGAGSGVFLRYFVDRQENLWVTSTVGILKISIRENLFKIDYPGASMGGVFVKDGETWWQFPQTDTVINPLNYEGRGYTHSFTEDDSGRIWIGTIRPFLLVYEPGERSLTYVPMEKGHWSELVFQNPVTHHLWVSTNHGLFLLEPGEGGLDTYHMGDTIILDPDHPTLVRDIHVNSEGIWVVTNQGLFLIDPEAERPVHHYTQKDGFPTQNLMDLHEDDEGVFWLGSVDNGLIRWDRTSNKFRPFTSEDGFSSNTIFSIHEDQYHTLWMPSNYGLIAFNKADYSLRIFLSKDGIACDKFTGSSHFQTEEGRIYLGSPLGLTSFHPKDFQQSKSRVQSPLHLSKIQVLEQDQENFTDLTDGYFHDGQIVLQPNDRILKVKVTLLDYENSAENQYAYKLLGKEENWIYTWQNQFSLMNLPYGKYTLQIKGKGASGTWAEKTLDIPIHVLKPIYMRPWFIMSMILLVFAILFFSIRRRIWGLKKRQQRLEDEVKKRTEQIESDKKVIEIQAEQLRELDEVKTHFFANITHEFRTPLTLVIGPVEQEIEKDLPQATHENLKGVLKNARNLLGLVNQLLDLSKLESGLMNLEVVQGEIVGFTSDLVTQFLPLARQKQIELTFSSALSDWETNFDAEKWTKTVYNLLSNAIKYAPATGAVEVTLGQKIVDQHEWIELGVKDTGVGIAQENLDRIFDRFYQVNDSATRVQGGTGIGLALVKELVEFQNGNISVKSTVGEGTKFSVSLPVYQDVLPLPVDLALNEEGKLVSEVIASSSSNPSHGQLSGPGNGQENANTESRLQLLLVEDNVELRTFIRSCIDSDTYQITEAANGEEGLQKAIEMVPDLIISDIMMPKMDGYDLTRAIRGHLATSHIPLILLTAKASLESRLEGLRRGADAYLTKPFSSAELGVRIDKLIELRQALQQRYSISEEIVTETTLPGANDAPDQAEDEFISQLKSFLSENLKREDLNPAEVAKHFGLSRTQLYRKLKALTDTTIGEYLRGFRCEYALQLIRENKLSLSEIAYESGFSSPSYFSRIFKKHFGKAPSAFLP